jgi:hypothetical protein
MVRYKSKIQLPMRHVSSSVLSVLSVLRIACICDGFLQCFLLCMVCVLRPRHILYCQRLTYG